jgi:hypothetical protein
VRSQIGHIAVDLEYRAYLSHLVTNRQISRDNVKIVAGSFEGIEAVAMSQSTGDLTGNRGAKSRVVVFVFAGLARLAGEDGAPAQRIDLDLDHLGPDQLTHHQAVEVVPRRQGLQLVGRRAATGADQRRELGPQRVRKGVRQRQIAILAKMGQVAQGQVLIAPAQQNSHGQGTDQAGEGEVTRQRKASR